VLQAADAERVRRGADEPGDEEAADPARAWGRPGWAGRDDELVRVRDGAEPLLPGDPPGVAVRVGPDGVCADVRTALRLREKLGGPRGGQEGWEEAVAELGVGVLAECAHEPGGAGNGAGVPALAGVGEHVEERGLLEGRRADDSGGPHGAAGLPVGGVE